jgi:pyruvate/2-oxoglutarate dehydrogenase complex dihydrolipoamide acyltransferase (E2) component
MSKEMLNIRLPDEMWTDIEPGTEALLDNWLVKEGDTVIAGQPVASAVLIKTAVDVTAPASGRIVKILVPTDGTFGRGRDLALLEPSS